jgi:hypothetical protein
MKLSYLTNLILVIFVLLLLWLNNQPDNDSQSVQTVSEIKVDSITSITIDRIGRKSIQLQQINSDWQLIRPFQAKANEKRIALLLSLLTHSSQQRLNIDANTDLAQYGLTMPKLSLTFNELLFEIGDPSPIQKGRYVKHNNTIYVIDDAIAHLVNSSANSFINNQLIPQKYKLVKLELPNTTFELIDGHWRSSNNFNQNLVLRIVENWQHAQALQVLSKADTTTLADITLWFDNKNQPLRLAMQLNQQNLSLYDIDAQLSYQFTGNFAEALFLTDQSNTSQH